MPRILNVLALRTLLELSIEEARAFCILSAGAPSISSQLELFSTIAGATRLMA